MIAHIYLMLLLLVVAPTVSLPKSIDKSSVYIYNNKPMSKVWPFGQGHYQGGYSDIYREGETQFLNSLALIICGEVRARRSTGAVNITSYGLCEIG